MKKKYSVSIGRSEIIMANSPKEAEEKFAELVNECVCDQVSVREIKQKKTKNSNGK